MLFAVKNRLALTLVCTAALIAVALLGKRFFDLPWSLELPGAFPRDALFGLAAVIASDGLLHGLFGLAFGEAYLRRYRKLAEFFSSQKAPQILAGGFLAGAEELVFRGLLLEGLRTHLGAPTWVAVVFTGLIFGLCHLIPSRPLYIFSLWAVWEGIILSLVYVLSGSLAVAVAVHWFHDVLGFSLFAFQRRMGWPLYFKQQA